MISVSTKHQLKKLIPKPILDSLIELKHSFATKVLNYQLYTEKVSGMSGIEIGGPSLIFKTTLPVYKEIRHLDGVNFSSSTIWEGSLVAGNTFRYFKNRTGKQFISDGTNLGDIKDQSYDFVLSSNCLEHIANPLKALVEWKRVLKSGGSLILILPNKLTNFDHKRETTSFSHLLEDYENNTSEYDLTHLDEILMLHDLSMDPAAGDFENFKKRSLDNFNNRTLHHHVFDLDLMLQMAAFLDMTVAHQIETKRDFVMMAIKR